MGGAKDHILTPGTWIGEYEILAEVAEGATAIVYKVVHRASDRIFAAKVMRGAIASTFVRQKFRDEADILKQLQHPNIVRVNELLETDELLICIMDYIDGSTLAAYLTQQKGGLSEVLALSILRQVVDAVAYAHHEGIVHRDLKPANIMLTQESDGTLLAFVTDFGLAKILSRGLNTITGMQIGTIAYMAPEQIQDSSRVDGRADIYALGITLYECLTGSLPFPYSSVYKMMEAHIHQKVPPVRRHRLDLPPDWDVFIEHATQKAREDRFESGQVMLGALSALARKLGLDDRTTRPVAPHNREELLFKRTSLGQPRMSPLLETPLGPKHLSHARAESRQTQEHQSVSPAFIDDKGGANHVAFSDDDEATTTGRVSLSMLNQPAFRALEASASLADLPGLDDTGLAPVVEEENDSDQAVPVFVDTDARRSVLLSVALSGDGEVATPEEDHDHDDEEPLPVERINEKLQSMLDSSSIAALGKLGVADTADLQISDDTRRELREAAAAAVTADAVASLEPGPARPVATPPEKRSPKAGVDDKEPETPPTHDDGADIAAPNLLSMQERSRKAAIELVGGNPEPLSQTFYIVVVLLGLGLVGLVVALVLVL